MSVFILACGLLVVPKAYFGAMYRAKLDDCFPRWLSWKVSAIQTEDTIGIVTLRVHPLCQDR
jgi:hypothetical protein